MSKWSLSIINNGNNINIDGDTTSCRLRWERHLLIIEGDIPECRLRWECCLRQNRLRWESRLQCHYNENNDGCEQNDNEDGRDNKNK